MTRASSVTGEEERATRPDLSFRECVSTDVPACAQMAEEAWPADPRVASRLHLLAGLEGYMEYGLTRSNWTDIACVDLVPAGLLFGRIDGLQGRPQPSDSPLGELPWAAKSLMGARRDMLILLRFLWNLELTEMKARLNMPRADASIEMFIVGSAHRGEGIGTRLLERFVEEARRSGSKKVTVYTDDTLSNWQFYERRGFKRTGGFHDNITSYYSQKRCRGMVYAMDL